MQKITQRYKMSTNVKNNVPNLASQGKASARIIMSQTTDHLKNCTDASDLKRELRSMCSRFGSIMRLDVLMAKRGETRQAMCFWRMETPEREDEVMSEFGVGRFAGDLVMIVDLEAGESAAPASSPDASRFY